MKRALIIFILAAALICAPFVLAQEDFTASAKNSVSLCPCSGQGYYVSIANTGTVTSTYAFSVNKEVEEWVTISPDTFSLAPGTQTKIPLYVNSPCDQRQAVPFTIFISTSNGLAKALSQQVAFVPCYGFGITQGQALAEVPKGKITVTPFNGTYQACAHEKMIIPLLVQNTDAAFDNTYSLRTDNPDAKLSITEFPLKSGSAGIVILEYAPNHAGQSSVTIEGLAKKGEVTLTRQITFDARECYSLSVDIPEGAIGMCAGIPEEQIFRVSNNGVSPENFTLALDGAPWASLDRSSVILNPSRRTNRTLFLNPNEGIFGTYPITLKASLAGNPLISAQDTFSVVVSSLSTCYGVQAAVDGKISIKGESFVPFTITNSGSRQAMFYWNVSGVDWASIDESEAMLNSGEEFHANIHLLPPQETAKGVYPITLAITSAYSASSEQIVVEYASLNPTAKAIKSFLSYYRYYLYALAIIIALLFLFRKNIMESYRESKKQSLIRKNRLEALKKARIARLKMTRKSQKASKRIAKEQVSVGLRLGTWLLLIMAVLIGLAFAFFPTLITQFLQRFGLAVAAIIIVCSVIVGFLLRSKRRARKKNTSRKRR